MEKENLFHFIYKTTNLKNGKFYIGMHSTNNLDDGYLGSGKHLRNSVYYHGKENFKREILEFLPDRNSLKKREKEIVNENLLKDNKCMNLKEGGDGGNGFWNDVHKENFLKSSKLTRFTSKNNPSYDNEKKKRSSINLKKLWDSGDILPSKSFKNKKHSEKTKKIIGDKNKIKQLGVNNSQYGSRWITNGIENKKIKKDDIIPNNWVNGRTLN